MDEQNNYIASAEGHVIAGSVIENILEATGEPRKNRTLSLVVGNNNSQNITVHQYPQVEPCLPANSLRVQCDYAKLKSKLQSFYKKAILPRVAWLRKGCDTSMQEFYTHLELQITKSNECISLEKLFVPGETRILITGDPGYGKTSLSWKIAYDWAQGAEYVNNFRFVFIIPLRDLHGQTIEAALIKIGEKCGFEECEAIPSSIQNNCEDTLIIVDGFDELLPEERENVDKLLFKQKYGECTVILTCRTGFFNMDDKEIEKVFGSCPINNTFYDKSIAIRGVKIDRRKEFLQKFVKDRDLNSVLQELNLLEILTDGCQSPLLLILIAFIINENLYMKFEMPKFKTQVYTLMINCILKWGMSKLESRYDIDTNLLDIDNVNEHIKCCSEFGKIALENIRNGNLYFEINSITEKIYQLGFLQCHNQSVLFTSNLHYEPFHFTFVEYFAAFYIWKNYCENSFKFDMNALVSVNEIFCKSGSTSMILPFLIGLLGERAADFFNSLTPFSHLYAFSEVGLWRMLSEFVNQQNPNTQILKAITSFIPCDIHTTYDPRIVQFFKSPFYREILFLGIKEGLIGRIIVRSDKHCALPSNVEIPHLVIVILPNTTNLEMLEELKRITCQHLHISLHLFALNVNVSVKNYLTDYLSLRAKSLTITCDSVIATHILTSITSKVEHLVYECRKDGVQNTEILCLLLQKSQAKTLMLTVKDESVDLNKVLKNSNVDSFILLNRCNKLLEVNLDELTHQGEKFWNFIQFNKTRLFCSKPCNSVSTLSIEEYDHHTGNALTLISPNALHCPLTLLPQVSKFNEQSLRQLIIALDKEVKFELWTRLPTFHNLECLEFTLRGDFPQNKMKDLFTYYISLNVPKLVIWYIENDFQFATTFLENLSSGCMPSSITVYTALTSSEKTKVNQLCEIISQLLRCQ